MQRMHCSHKYWWYSDNNAPQQVVCATVSHKVSAKSSQGRYHLLRQICIKHGVMLHEIDAEDNYI